MTSHGQTLTFTVPDDASSEIDETVVHHNLKDPEQGTNSEIRDLLERGSVTIFGQGADEVCARDRKTAVLSKERSGRVRRRWKEELGERGKMGMRMRMTLEKRDGG